MVDIYLDKTCNIFNISNTFVWWEQVQNITTTYSNISCDFWEDKKWWFIRDWFVKEGSETSYKVIISWDKTLQRWQIIELIDSGINFWKFIIAIIIPIKDIFWELQHFELRVSEKRI